MHRIHLMQRKLTRKQPCNAKIVLSCNTNWLTIVWCILFSTFLDVTQYTYTIKLKVWQEIAIAMIIHVCVHACALFRALVFLHLTFLATSYWAYWAVWQTFTSRKFRRNSTHKLSALKIPLYAYECVSHYIMMMASSWNNLPEAILCNHCDAVT